MKKLLAKIRKILRDRRTRRFLTRFVSGIAAIVVFVTTYALVLPAITMEKEADCGIEAHQHDDSCYTWELICDIPESDGHQHGESCYSTITSLMCGMDEHEHSLENGCYDDDGNLICEAKEHKHSDGCYEEVRELTCQTPESEGHHHTDACYEKVLSCGKEVHVHSAACYENDPVPDSAVAAGTSSAAAATTSAVSVSSVGMTLSFEGDNAGTGETDEPAVIEQPADQGRAGGDDGFVDSDESGKSEGSEKSDGSGKTDSSAEAASSGGVNADGTLEMTYGGENAGTGSTETANAALTNTDNGPAAADQYVPALEAVDFNTILNDRTGIYYYHVADGEIVEDSSAIPAEDWKRIPNNKERMKNMDEPELGSNDLLRVYLSYTIPAGSLNATNPVARYRLPSNLHLTDSQVKAINENVNGMTGQYVDMSALEITDPARYYAYLGVEAVEGNRRPDEAVEDYLAEQARKTGTDPDEAAEYISAVVRVENVYDVDGIYGDKDAYLGQDLIFTFASYSIEKNQHEYDSKGQPTKAGREIEGWFTLDLNMGQVDLGEAEITTSTVVESEADYADGNAEDDRAEDGRTEADRAEDGRTEADRAEDGRTEDENAADGQTEDEHNANDNNAENSAEDKDNNPAGESEEDTENPQNNTVTTERAERTAEIVFVEDGRDGKNNKIEKISTSVRVVEETVIQTQDNDAEENSEESGAGNTEKSAAGSPEESAADNDADRSGKEKTDQTVMPAMSFTDSIRVSTGKPAGIDEDAEGTLGSAVRSLPQEAEVTVHVEADEGTFPAGTTMVLKAVEDLDAVAEAVTETVENSDPSVSADDADHQSEQTKESRNRNTEEKKNLKTYGFQAVDITFLDKNGKDIQPAKPVRVALTSEIAEQVKEEAKTSEVADPLVVHVDDDGNAEQMELLAPEEIKPAQGKTEQELLEEDRTSDSEQEENGTTDVVGETPSVGFTADSFSVYALVYTVDFEYSVNGKMYQFSLPGGGFVSFTDLVEVLGIIGDTNSEENWDENGAVITENGEENGINEGAEEDGIDSDTNTALTLGDVEVSEATRKFVANVANVEFSSPELVDVSKVENETTVGQIKESRGLEVEYSAELTEEQIAEINAQTVEAGDWALISLLPFTSVEMMTITMKDGSVFTIKVTDAQAASTSENPYTNDFRSNNGNRFVIWGWGTDGKGYALNKDGGTTVIDPNNLDNAPVDVQWTIEYGYNNGNNDYRYYIRSVANNKYFALNSGYHVGRDLVQDDVCGIHLYPPYTYHYNQQHPYDPRYADSSNTGWLVEGWGWTRLNLSTWNNNFEGHNNHCSNTNITKLTPPNEYTFTVKTEDIRKGYVSCGNQTQAIELTATSNTSNTWIKSNKDIIKAEPVSSGKYMFDYWDLDGKKLDLGPEIGIGELELSGNGGVLTAHFKMDPSYTPSDEEKEGHSIDKTALANWLSNLKEREVPFGTDGCNKTAELFDYENRIYRVDLTAKSNLTTFVGDIDLGFMLDVSSSMKFPAKLSPVEGLESVDINHINDNSTNQAELTKGTTYYLISDKGSTATVYEIRWGTWRYDQYGNTRTGWGYKDASKDDSQMNYIRPASVWSGGESGLSYPIYTDGDTGHDRRYYLETSISNTITELNNILNALSVAEVSSKDPTVKIAWNTFHKWVVNPHHEFTSVRGTTINPTYSYSGGTSADLALLDAAGKKRSDDDGVSSHLKYNWENGMYYTDVEGFQWDEDAAKYAVLITDGAPQRNGIDVGAELVEDGADFLKKGADGIAGTDDDVKLMTVGLSMGDVKKGSVRLYDISSPDAEGFPLFYKAEYGDELQYALYQVLREAMADAIVQCDITDTVNEAFYPIDLNTGMPLGNNDIISLGGVRLGNNVNALTAEQKKAGYGIVHKSGETYTVTWLNQDVYGEEEGGWQGTVYVKAREDFLGGNSVRTNPSDEDGPKAKVEAKSYKMKPEDEPIALKQSLIAENGTVELDTPRVNVNELDIPELDTEWNVYLGTTVDDALLQLKKLYEEIKVLEVVKLGQAQDANGSGFSDKITGNKDTSYYYPMKESASDVRESEASGENEFFYLKDLIKKINNGSDLTDEDWQRMVELSEYPEEDKEHPEVAGPFNTGISFTYDLYGQDCPGTITLRIVKDHDFGEHVTDHTGAPVETYTLKVIFTPNYDHIPEGIGGEDPWEYHTGRNRPLGYGNAAGTEEPLNNHEINVFAKKLQILKVDQAENVITDDRATFKLYREALDGEEDQILPPEDVPSFLPTGKNYILADTLTTDREGKAITNIDISKLPDNAPYFLVETDAPDGYSLLPGALEVRAMTDAETNTGTVPQDVWTKVPVTTPPQTSNTKWSPYVLSNWEQNATIIINANEALAGYAIREGNITYDHNQEDTLVKVKYKIRNNEGIELPNTGGPGTHLFTILGSILVLGAGALLWRRRRLI